MDKLVDQLLVGEHRYIFAHNVYLALILKFLILILELLDKTFGLVVLRFIAVLGGLKGVDILLVTPKVAACDATALDGAVDVLDSQRSGCCCDTGPYLDDLLQ